MKAREFPVPRSTPGPQDTLFRAYTLSTTNTHETLQIKELEVTCHSDSLSSQRRHSAAHVGVPLVSVLEMALASLL